MADYISAGIQELRKVFSEVKTNNTSDGYNRLRNIVAKFESEIRENIQNISKSEILKIIAKLEKDQKLTAEELKFVELWIVGDAEYYAKLENNFNDWLVEIDRIINEINKFSDDIQNIETLSILRALLGDAIRLIPSISFLLEQKERINNFRTATQELDQQEGNTLVTILKNRLSSKEF